MFVLYPSNPFDKKSPDETYAEEFAAMEEIGARLSLYSAEDSSYGELNPRPKLEGRVLYRGWMLRESEYESLSNAVSSVGGEMETTKESYLLCHYLPRWYESCAEFTAETVFVEKPSDLAAVIAEKASDWEGFFVKDFVKSLTMSRGSVAKSAEEVHEIVGMIAKYRGSLEGGICLRRLERFVVGSERRYFAANGIPKSCDGEVPQLVREIASRIDSPFFSIDTALREDGVLRLVELGDGQVSDLKEWPPSKFAEFLSSSFDMAARKSKGCHV